MDLYELLGIEREASEAEVRRAYQKRARVLHPHLNPGDPEAALRFQEVAAAFGVLSDPKRREAYDRGERPEVARLAAQGSFEGFDFSAGVRVERVGFREIFDAVLQPAAGVERGRGRGSRGEDAAHLRGGAARRRAPAARSSATRLVPRAGGRGAGGRSPALPALRGHGADARRAAATCSSRGAARACDGTGAQRRRACAHVRGRGPGAGRARGSTCGSPRGRAAAARCACPAAATWAGGAGLPATSSCTWTSRSIPSFAGKATTSSCTVAVSIVEAALGGHVEVATPDGAVTIELPAGTQAGQRFRLRKRGMPRLGDGVQGRSLCGGPGERAHGHGRRRAGAAAGLRPGPSPDPRRP